MLLNLQNAVDKQIKLPKHIIKPIGRPGNRPILKKPDIKLDNNAATSQVRVKGWLPGKNHLPTDTIKGLGDKINPRTPVEMPHIIKIPKEPIDRPDTIRRPSVRYPKHQIEQQDDRPPFIDPRTLIKGHRDIFPGRISGKKMTQLQKVKAHKPGTLSDVSSYVLRSRTRLPARRATTRTCDAAYQRFNKITTRPRIKPKDQISELIWSL